MRPIKMQIYFQACGLSLYRNVLTVVIHQMLQSWLFKYDLNIALLDELLRDFMHRCMKDCQLSRNRKT